MQLYNVLAWALPLPRFCYLLSQHPNLIALLVESAVDLLLVHLIVLALEADRVDHHARYHDALLDPVQHLLDVALGNSDVVVRVGLPISR